MTAIDELLKRIERDPRILSGKPTVRGLRVSVGRILNYLAAGMTHAEILEEFPELSAEDLEACELYGFKLMVAIRRASDEGRFEDLVRLTQQIDPDLLEALLNYNDHCGQRMAQLPRARAG